MRFPVADGDPTILRITRNQLNQYGFCNTQAVRDVRKAIASSLPAISAP